MKKIKNILAVLLVAVMILSLCSCKAKNEENTTASAEEATTTAPVTTSAEGETGESETAEPTQSQTQTTETVQTSESTEYQTVTENITSAGQGEVTQTVVPTGVETITDGSKTVVFPAALRNSQDKYPVISWANGTGCPTQLYMKLIEEIAKAGYIVVADATVMSGDGAAQIDSINYIFNKNNDPSSVFSNKVDTAKVGVCGQSQGGRSCVNAAQRDSRIRALVSIAGASTADEARGIGIPCLFLTATNDNIVKSSDWCLPSYNAVAGRAAYASLKGGNHLSFNSMSGYTIDWFNAYLKNDANAKAVFSDSGKLANDGAWQDFKNKN
ncbi:MAG: alpha/beta hydrolase [Clostridiales bacterium]|nr:alpha/beta hydrolase [Clostridiales bacterium]